MKIAQHLIVEGRVQGVSFRYFTKTAADKLQVTGWVRNLQDGRVEAIVQGDETTLELMVQQVKKGPLLARVKDIAIRRIGLQVDIKDFQIIENSEGPCRIEDFID